MTNYTITESVRQIHLSCQVQTFSTISGNSFGNSSSFPSPKRNTFEKKYNNNNIYSKYTSHLSNKTPYFYLYKFRIYLKLYEPSLQGHVTR